MTSDGCSQLPARREVLALGLALAASTTSSVEALASSQRADLPAGADGFDFLLGSWAVQHRKLAKRLKGSSEWIEFPGTLDVDAILGGAGDIDRNLLIDPAGPYHATSLRVFDQARKEWSIYRIDGRDPTIANPVVGRFDGGVGRFYADDTLDGRPIRVRFIYEDLGTAAARWSQAFSDDAGQTWEVNWTMHFTRRTGTRT